MTYPLIEGPGKTTPRSLQGNLGERTVGVDTVVLTSSTPHHVAANYSSTVALLVSARDPPRLRRACGRLCIWTSRRFYEHSKPAVRCSCGDLASLHHFGLGEDDYDRLIHTTDWLRR